MKKKKAGCILGFSIRNPKSAIQNLGGVVVGGIDESPHKLFGSG